MPTIATQIEIAASPAHVRKTLLDFESYPQWSTKQFKSIEVTSGDKNELKKGDTLKVVLATGMTFKPVVESNTPEEFSWIGSLPGIFSGTHSFKFQPSTVTPGHTTLLQKEDFTGLISFLMGPTWSWGKTTQAGFEGLNEELKGRVEATL